MVLIDIPMPEDCRDCPMNDYNAALGETRCGACNKIMSANFKTIPWDGRPEWCPLKEVQE